MTRARILADYVSGGTTAAEFDYLDGVTSNIQTQLTAKAPLNSPVLVTPNLGTPSAGVVTNLSGVLPVGVTGGSGLTALGTVTAGNLSNSAIVYPNDHIIQIKHSASSVYYSTTSSNWGDNLMDHPALAITPSSASNKIFLIGVTQCRPTSDYIYLSFRRVISGGATTNDITGNNNGLVQTQGDHRHFNSFSILDSPNTTSEITYNIQFRNDNNSTTVAAGHDDVNATITAFEIKG